MMPTFQPKGSFPPMTAAERQRLCRERGKGRHRGWRPTRAYMNARRAAEARAAALAANAAAVPAVPPTPAASGPA